MAFVFASSLTCRKDEINMAVIEMEDMYILIKSYSLYYKLKGYPSFTFSPIHANARNCAAQNSM